MKAKHATQQQQLKDALAERYLAYALSTITARSLPDVRDGMKPVHRRLIHAMAELKLSPQNNFKKCARIVGDVMGKYHPHGDAAIYDAMVRMAQEFSLRYPLVDGQGNFGNIDGDNPAAMRYTEARMSQTAALMLKDLHRGAVDFRDTYDGEGKEPQTLPAAFPNLLANGAQGIAVGMATHIPPHNIVELCDGLLALLQNPDIHTVALTLMIPGPDFPTGGVLIENREQTINAYHTGKGSFRLRASWLKEDIKGGSYQIVIDAIPFQVAKSRLVEKIADLLQNRKLPLISDIRDESTEDVRLVIQPKNRTVDPNHIMALLFKQTDLEIKFALNMNVLDNGQIPKIMSLREVLQKWLEHRRNVMLRCGRYRLDEIAARLDVLTAYLIAYRNIDIVIQLIRETDDAKAALVKHLKISDNYADTILAMRLRQLHKLQEKAILQENNDLRAEQKTVEMLLADEAKQNQALQQEITQIKTDYAPTDARRTRIEKLPEGAEDVPEELLFEREPITVIYSQKDWVRSVKTHIALDTPHRFKDGDDLRFLHHAMSTDAFVMMSSLGKSYLLEAKKIPSGRSFGDPIRLLLEWEAEEQMVNFDIYDAAKSYLLASSDGYGFIVKAEKLAAQTRTGKQVMILKNGARVTHCLAIDDGLDAVAVLSENRRLLVFALAEVSSLTRGQGVVLQKTKEGGMADIQLFDSSQGLCFRKSGKIQRLKDDTAWRGKRAAIGKLPPIGFPHKNRFF